MSKIIVEIFSIKSQGDTLSCGDCDEGWFFISMHSSAFIYTQGSNVGNVYFLWKGYSYCPSKTCEKPKQLFPVTKANLCRLQCSRSLAECHQLWNQPSYNISSFNLQWSHQIKNWLSLESRKSITRKSLYSLDQCALNIGQAVIGDDKMQLLEEMRKLFQWSLGLSSGWEITWPNHSFSLWNFNPWPCGAGEELFSI